MNVLLDTCVFSELRLAKGKPSLREAVTALAHDALYMSVITLGEIAKGVELMTDGRKKREIALWFAEIDKEFADRVLVIDGDTTRIWGEITARAQIKGIQIPAADGLVAATALRHGMHVMTRNTKHFVATGVLVVDPWHMSS